MDKIAVLIPCFNEVGTIRKVVTDFRRELPEAVIYVYDNNSTDQTDRAAWEAGAVVRYEHKQGKGNVIRRMFQEIDAECYIIADGDDTYPAEEAGKMVEMILENQADMVVGDRLSSTYFAENKRRFHGFGNKLVRCAVNLLFHNDIPDIMTGYRALSYRFVKTFPVLSKGFEIETEMSIHAADKNLRVESIAVGYKDRPQGSVSKLRTYSDGKKVLVTIVRLFCVYRPFAFFGAFAAIFMITGMIPAALTLIRYLRSGALPGFYSQTAVVLPFLASVQSFFTGLQLKTVEQKNRQDFEMELQRAALQEKLLCKADGNGQ